MNATDASTRLSRSSTLFALKASMVASILALGTLSACVPQEKYNDLELAYRSQQQQLLRTQGDLDTCRANESRLRSQLAQAAGDLASLDALRKGQNVDVEKLLADYEELLKKVGNMSGGPLPDELNKALLALAAMYPDLLQFDERRGMIRFAADFTFDPGSVGLKPSAIAALKALAPILNSSEASPFEVVVVGHTDNVPIRKSAAQHPTNMHLSAHRAIAVRDALNKDGVAASRFLIAGYGEYRPLVANGPNGAAQNRRVDVYLMPYFVPTTMAVEPGSAAPTPSAPAAAPKVVDDEPTK
ncbi:MAG: OmpA family protein [Phycisphaerae bacterium]|nr:OmpA family protein [Phycisphaerae bacterium]